jgi:hypothetical protein
LEKAGSCPYFECKNTKDSLKSAFVSFLRHANRAEVAERYPDLAALLWVLEMERDEVQAPKKGEPTYWTRTPISLPFEGQFRQNHTLFTCSLRGSSLWVDSQRQVWWQ